MTDINIFIVAHHPVRVIKHIIARDNHQQVKAHHKIFAECFYKPVFNEVVNSNTGHTEKIDSIKFILQLLQ
jgi:hypothetical protein